MIQEMRPIFRTVDQSGTNGVVADVAGFRFERVPGAQPVIEEVSLPPNSMCPRGETLPVPNHFRKAFQPRDGQDRVQMIGHQQEKLQCPDSPAVIKRRILEKLGSEAWPTKLIQRPMLATNGDEKPSITGHERRRGVVKRNTSGHADRGP